MVVNAHSPACPKCGAWITKVVMTKFEDESTHIIRRRHCEFCGEKFYSAQPVERIAEIKWTTGLKGISIPKLIKVHGSRQRKRTA